MCGSKPRRYPKTQAPMLGIGVTFALDKISFVGNKYQILPNKIVDGWVEVK
jgi:hypothetical protein